MNDASPEMTKFRERLVEEIRETPGVAVRPEDGRATFGGVTVPQSSVTDVQNASTSNNTVEGEKDKEKSKEERVVAASNGTEESYSTVR